MFLWHRFQLWRANRMYDRICRLEVEAKALFEKASALIEKYAEDPQNKLPGIE